MRGQFLEHFKSWQFYNVLGSHAWPISRTYQIVPHWCNSWVETFCGHPSLLCIIVSHGRPDHTDVSQLQGQRLDTRKRMTREIENESICEGRVSLSCECRLCIRTARRQCSRISSVANFRTYQIVAHWCNSWVPVASLIDRRIRACVPVCLRI